MQICKRSLHGKNHCKSVLLISSALLILVPVSAEALPQTTKSVSTSTSTSNGTTVVSSSAMPAVSAPSMPTVSAPSIGDGFYIPGSSSFYTGTSNSSSSANSSELNAASGSSSSGSSAVNSAPSSSSAASSSATANNSSSATAASSANKSSLNQNISSLLNSSNALSALGLSGSSLTASDMSSLDSLGALGSVSSLLGQNNSLSNYASSSQDSVLLNQILTELNNLKKQIAEKNTSSDKTNTSAEKNSAVSEVSFNSKLNIPQILRFTVNGYDVLSTCKTVYFSKKESDGTFLLTGDRRYVSDNKMRAETFYLLFHAVGSCSGTTSYTVTPAVSQDYENKYSFLYQLSKKNNITASRTGNLVTMRVNEQTWNMDLLVDLNN